MDIFSLGQEPSWLRLGHRYGILPIGGCVLDTEFNLGNAPVDVSALYSSTPHTLAIEAVKYHLKQYSAYSEEN